MIRYSTLIIEEYLKKRFDKKTLHGLKNVSYLTRVKYYLKSFLLLEWLLLCVS
mgnify:CR=1 FL=1